MEEDPLPDMGDMSPIFDPNFELPFENGVYIAKYRKPTNNNNKNNNSTYNTIKQENTRTSNSHLADLSLIDMSTNPEENGAMASYVQPNTTTGEQAQAAITTIIQRPAGIRQFIKLSLDPSPDIWYLIPIPDVQTIEALMNIIWQIDQTYSNVPMRDLIIWEAKTGCFILPLFWSQLFEIEGKYSVSSPIHYGKRSYSNHQAYEDSKYKPPASAAGGESSKENYQFKIAPNMLPERGGRLIKPPPGIPGSPKIAPESPEPPRSIKPKLSHEVSSTQKLFNDHYSPAKRRLGSGNIERNRFASTPTKDQQNAVSAATNALSNLNFAPQKQTIRLVHQENPAPLSNTASINEPEVPKPPKPESPKKSAPPKFDLQIGAFCSTEPIDSPKVPPKSTMANPSITASPGKAAVKYAQGNQKSTRSVSAPVIGSFSQDHPFDSPLPPPKHAPPAPPSTPRKKATSSAKESEPTATTSAPTSDSSDITLPPEHINITLFDPNDIRVTSGKKRTIRISTNFTVWEVMQKAGIAQTCIDRMELTEYRVVADEIFVVRVLSSETKKSVAKLGWTDANNVHVAVHKENHRPRILA